MPLGRHGLIGTGTCQSLLSLSWFSLRFCLCLDSFCHLSWQTSLQEVILVKNVGLVFGLSPPRLLVAPNGSSVGQSFFLEIVSLVVGVLVFPFSCLVAMPILGSSWFLALFLGSLNELFVCDG